MHTKSLLDTLGTFLVVTLALFSTSCATSPEESGSPDDRPEFGLVVPLSEDHLPKSGGLIQAEDLDSEAEKKKKKEAESAQPQAETTIETTVEETTQETTEDAAVEATE